ncbi:sensor histidine kinase [Amycolatopsis anabasis]|uniref:sensor histidine kinase n=1 Tax=Amycolatopsis anabasis TaxID=1840409 RepID=UPI00131B83D7|nr:histidine kinase [Amycolatopsis anabasis]
MSKPVRRATAARLEYPWLLPAELLEVGDAEGRRRRRVRNWIVDTSCFILATVYGLLASESLVSDPTITQPLVIADQIVGALGCAALWLRRRWPVTLALVLVPFSAFSLLVQGAMLVALFTVAVHRPFPVVAGVGGLCLLTTPVYAAVRPDPTLTFTAAVLLGTMAYVAVTGWGMFVRSRRQLMISFHERARRAETEATLRAEQAQRAERDRIAREIHDVLAHRLSLLSLYAGALEFRSDVSRDEIARAAGVIRESGHQALQDVREVIGVLRAPVGDLAEGEGTTRPQPTLAQLPQLVEESRQAGTRIEVRTELADLEAVPANQGRTAYRIIQEALTNARKHAPDAEVTVAVTGSPGDGLTVEVRNRLAAPEARSTKIPGSGQGLIGLTERATLAGGRLEHGPTGSGEFRLAAWLPWSP